jgi:hypothetical protein
MLQFDLFPTAVRTASGSKGIISVENSQALPIVKEFSTTPTLEVGGLQHPQNRGAKVEKKF